jgi:hypothetical protein
MIFFVVCVPSSAVSWIVYSPPSISGDSAKSFCATPFFASTRFCDTTAPRGDINIILMPMSVLPTSEPVARRSARNQIVSPG